MKSLQFAYNNPNADGSADMKFGMNTDGSIYSQFSYSVVNEKDANIDGNGYKRETIFFHHTDYAYLMAEGVGFQSIYHVDGSIQVTQDIVQGKFQRWFALVSLTGQTLASKLGDVEWFGSVDLIANYHTVSSYDLRTFDGPEIHDASSTPIGRVTISLPIVDGVVQLKIHAGFNFTNEQGNGATDQFNLNFTIGH